MQVYPAAGLVNYVSLNTPIYFIDPKPAVNKNDYTNLTIIQSGGSEGTTTLVNLLSHV